MAELRFGNTNAVSYTHLDLKMPIAAGNLFMGTFNALTAVSNALKATQFGMPFEYEPLYITGYYKYKAGEIFSENGVNVSGDVYKRQVQLSFHPPAY